MTTPYSYSLKMIVYTVFCDCSLLPGAGPVTIR